MSAQDPAMDASQLTQENAALRAQLETQYKQMLQMVDTIQKVHLARITDAARELAPENGKGESNGMSAASFLSDYDNSISYMDGQHQALVRRSGVAPAEQAEQLRSLENKARKWAKKFLHKVKQAASKAEAAAGIKAGEAASPVGGLKAGGDVPHARRGKGTPLDTIDSVPSPTATPEPESTASGLTPHSSASRLTAPGSNGAAKATPAAKAATPVLRGQAKQRKRAQEAQEVEVARAAVAEERVRHAEEQARRERVAAAEAATRREQEAREEAMRAAQREQLARLSARDSEERAAQEQYAAKHAEAQALLQQQHAALQAHAAVAHQNGAFLSDDQLAAQQHRQWQRTSGANSAHASSTDTPALQRDGGSMEAPQSYGGGATPRSVSGRRGSEVLARVQKHFSRTTNDASESGDVTLESARSSEMGSRMGNGAGGSEQGRGKKRFTYFNSLFKGRKNSLGASGAL